MEQTKEFLRAVLPTQGFPCIALKHKKWNGFKHKVFLPHEDLDYAISKWVKTAALERLDLYFCISSLVAPTHAMSDTEKPRVRVQANCHSTRVFVLDVDIKADSASAYASKQEAATALRILNATLGFPTPTVVDSGGGLHVYWHIAHDVDSREWRRVAADFKRILSALDPKLAVDTTRVADPAGVLRVPGSFNFKYVDVRIPVRLLRLSKANWTFVQYESRITELLLANNLGLPTSIMQSKKPRVSLLDFPKPKPIPLDSLLSKCQWMGKYHENQATASEPEWYAALGLADYVQLEDGITGAVVAHVFSEGHPEYAASTTDTKYEQVKLRQSGPTVCTRFTAIRPEWCAGCPFAGQITTPVQLENTDVEAAAPVVVYEAEYGPEELALPLPPPPYFRGESGGIYVRVMGSDDGPSKPKKIYDYDIFPTRRFRDEETGGEAIELCVRMPRDGQRLLRIPTGMLLDDRRFAVSLADRGVIATAKNMKLLCDYLISYTQLLQKNESVQEEFARFGWRDIMDDPKFVVAGEYFTKAGDTLRANIGASLRTVADAASCRGDIAEWVKGFGVYQNMPNAEPYVLAGMLGFASPLMPLLDQPGLIYNMLGPSGTGKSTSLEIVTSIWGKPNSQHAQVHDNRIPVLNTLGAFQNIPMAFDEVTTMEASELAEIAYAVSQGRGKNRADRAGRTRSNQVTWNTFVISTSNYSLYDKLAGVTVGNNAHAYRIFEVQCPPAHKGYQGKINEARQIIKAHYGQAGRVFIKYVITHMDLVRKTLIDVYNHILVKYEMHTAERFYAALLACVSVGGAIAKKLNLHNYDLNRIVAWAARQLRAVRESVQNVEGDAMSVLADFFQSNIRSTLRIVDGKPALTGMGDGVGNELKIRVEFVKNVAESAYISIPSLRKFCVINRVEYSWLVAKLKDSGVLRDDNSGMRRLAAGTGWTIPPVRCVSVNLARVADDVMLLPRSSHEKANEETGAEEAAGEETDEASADGRRQA